MRELLDVAREEQRAILAQEHAALERAAARESSLVARLGNLEEKRSAWVAEWARARFHEEGVTLSGMISLLQDGHREVAAKLRSAGEELGRLLADLRELNEQNAALLYHSLAFTRMLLGVLAGTEAAPGTYGPGPGRGKAAQARPRAILDWRA